MIVGIILAAAITAFCLWAIVEVVRSWLKERRTKTKKLGLAELFEVHKKPVTYVDTGTQTLGLAEMDVANGLSLTNHDGKTRGLTATKTEPEGDPIPLEDPGVPSENFHEILGKIAAGGELTQEELDQLNGLQDVALEGQVEKEDYPYGKAYAKQ